MTEYGKIKKVEFGFGGYQEACLGLSLIFEGKDWGVTWFISGGWNESIKITQHTKWTEENRSKGRVEMCKKIDELLVKAKVDSIDKLLNKPVVCEFDGTVLKSWRIFDEVL